MAADPQAEVIEFGEALRRHRVAAGLSQEALAERAGLSVRGISDLERGARTAPRKDTLQLLINALGLGVAERAALVTAARRLSVPRPADSPPRFSSMSVGQPLPVTRLPILLDELIGRDQEVATVVDLLRAPTLRLLTLTGTAGIGKTRVALSAAAAVQADFPGGVTYVPLATITDPDLMLPTTARAFGVREVAPDAVVEGLRMALQGRRILLVLDNFEQLLPAAPMVSRLLAACADLTVVVTSRSPLRIQGEHQYPVPPLALPALSGLPTVAELAAAPAVALFVERARQVRPDFALTPENAAAVAKICHQLEGLPLAIELGAARTNLLPPTALTKRLEPRLPLLTSGRRDVPARQRTMRDAIAWSHDLLSAAEQAVFCRLAVFVGGFTLDAAEAVGRTTRSLPTAHCPLPTADSVLDLLASLVDKSLLQQAAGADGEPRFAMLETVREHALERLRASAAEEVIRRAHATWFGELAERAEPVLVGPDQAVWMDRLAVDLDNLRAAIAWAVMAGEAEWGQRLAGALWRFWVSYGLLAEGRGWLEQALALDAPVPPGVRAKALQRLGNLALDQGDYAPARAAYEEALALRRGIGDELGTAEALNGLGLVGGYTGDPHGARALHEAALVIRRRLDDRRGVGNSLSNLGDIAAGEGDYALAWERHQEALAVRHALNDIGAAGYSTYNLGEVARARGEAATARALLDECLTAFRTVRDKLGVGYALYGLGQIALAAGLPTEAAARFLEALELRRALGDRRGLVEVIEGVGELAAACGEAAAAARLGGAADAQRDVLAAPPPAAKRAWHEHALAPARAVAGDDAFAGNWAAGRTLSADAAVAEARVFLRARLGSAPSPTAAGRDTPPASQP